MFSKYIFEVYKIWFALRVGILCSRYFRAPDLLCVIFASPIFAPRPPLSRIVTNVEYPPSLFISGTWNKMNSTKHMGIK